MYDVEPDSRRHVLGWTHRIPFGRPYYVFEEDRWGYLDSAPGSLESTTNVVDELRFRLYKAGHDRQTFPTEAELAILAVLWKRGPCTVREVHEALGREDGKGAGYTTTLKQLQVMATKELVTRGREHPPHVYAARVTEARTKRQVVKDLLERLFDGSSAKLVLQALSIKPASKTELEELRRLLDDKNGEDR